MLSVHRSVILWLYVIASLILMMVVIGGLTRLTGSGLSITQWKPLVGAIPPLSHLDWVKEFTLYQKIPQFQQLNHQMTLGEFQYIYWWEWSHRQIGRFLGIIFLIPLMVFWKKNLIPDGYKKIFIALFLAGGFQGFLGWFMVKSGLSDRVSVSQYRLALHLGFALLVYAFTVQIIICLTKRQKFHFPKFSLAVGLVYLIFMQIISGAFMAGTHAGFIYNTFPLLDGEWFPKGLWANGWISSFEDHLTVQFIHRIGAYSVLTLGVTNIFYYHKAEKKKLNLVLLLGLLIPVSLGITTLITVAPVEHIEIASLHQMSAIFLLTISIIYSNFIRKQINDLPL